MGICHEVGRQVLGDLAAQQAHRADIGLLQADVLDDGQGAVRAYGAAHVQFAVLPEGDVHLGVLDIAPDIAQMVGDRQDGPQGTAALDLQCQGGVFLLQGVAHHGRRRQGAAQGGRGHGEGLVDVSHPLGEVFCYYRDGFDGAVFRYCSD